MRRIIFLMIVALFLVVSPLFASKGTTHIWLSTGSGFYDTQTGDNYVMPEKQKNWVEQQDEYNYKLQHIHERKD